MWKDSAGGVPRHPMTIFRANSSCNDEYRYFRRNDTRTIGAIQNLNVGVGVLYMWKTLINSEKTTIHTKNEMLLFANIISKVGICNIWCINV